MYVPLDMLIGDRFALDLSHEANFANKQAMPLVSSLQSFEQRV